MNWSSIAKIREVQSGESAQLLDKFTINTSYQLLER